MRTNLENYNNLIHQNTYLSMELQASNSRLKRKKEFKRKASVYHLYNESLTRKQNGTGEMAQRLKSLVLLQRTGVQVSECYAAHNCL